MELQWGGGGGVYVGGWEEGKKGEGRRVKHSFTAHTIVIDFIDARNVQCPSQQQCILFARRGTRWLGGGLSL